MISKKTVSKEPIPASKVKNILEEFAEENELSYEQNLTLSHVSTFSKLTEEDASKLIEELTGAVDGKITEKIAVHIADLLPQDLDDMRLLFAKERVSLKNEEMEEILDIIDKYDAIIVDDEE
ncbi:RNA polymerase Rpb4 family protein [uncultured Methanobrevibacter sp.]|uniref:RNA polymerase Rpb4 family protein n=1 Tax=uncultured Methanobrevibacter sp. TaxID=253161 RepID=UPI0025F742B3|nr:RNA polymerase Rpb4 family protein [uncultured Methanobrevibacter sp.]